MRSYFNEVTTSAGSTIVNKDLIEFSYDVICMGSSYSVIPILKL